MMVWGWLLWAQAGSALGLPMGEGQGLTGNTTVLSVPAVTNLGFGFAPRWSFLLAGADAGYFQNWLSIGDLNLLMREAYLDEETKTRLLEKLPDPTWDLYLQTDLAVLSFSAGRWAFAFRPTGRVSLQIPPDLIRLAWEGMLLGHTYDFSSFQGQAILYNDLSVGYSFPIRVQDFLGVREKRDLLFGVNLSFLWGVGILDLEPSTKFLTVSNRGVTYGVDTVRFRSAGVMTWDSAFVVAPSGAGLNVGISAATEVDAQTSLTLSLENLFGFINWYRNPVEGMAVVDEDSLLVGDLRNTNDIGQYFDGKFRDTVDLAERGPFQTHFSPVFRAGVRIQPESYPQLALHATYTQGFKRDLLGTTTPRLDAGIEYALASWLPFRLGLTFGGRIGWGLGVGTGIHAGRFAMDMGYTALRGVGTLARGEHLYLTVGLVGPVTGTFRGTIIDSLTQKPVVAQVTVYTRTREISVPVDSMGHFSFPVMGRFRVKVEHPLYAFREYAFEVSPGEVVEETLQLRPLIAPVVLKFVDEKTGNPVSNVALRLEASARQPIEARSDTSGMWQGKLLEGRWRILAKHPDYQDKTGEIFVQGGKPLEHTFSLQPLYGELVIRVVDAQEAKPLQAHVVLKKGTGEVLLDTTTNSEGVISLRLREGAYRIEVDKPKTRYIRRQTRVELEGGTRVEKEIALLRKAMVFTFRNIYFDLNKATIRPESYPLLDSIAVMLLENPTVKVEIGGHTDARGSFTYNLRLSQARAEAVRQYLISKGVEADRLIAKGYGESRLIIKRARTEAEHQQNRRVEFRILGEMKR